MFLAGEDFRVFSTKKRVFAQWLPWSSQAGVDALLSDKGDFPSLTSSWHMENQPLIIFIPTSSTHLRSSTDSTFLPSFPRSTLSN